MRGAAAVSRYVLRAAGRGLRASAASASVAVVTMALALVLAGAFGITIANMAHVVERVGDELTLSAYLAPDVGDEGRAALAALAARIDGVQSVEAVSPEMALARFPERTGVSAGPAELLGENPLPASLEVRLRAASRSPAQAQRVRAALEALPGVADVTAGDDWVPGYVRALGFVRGAGLAVGGVLALATLVIVASTIRLAHAARRDELEILALVGASRTTMALPFLLEGLAQGACAGALGLLLLRGLFALARPAVDASLAFLAGPGAVRFFSLPESLALIAAGALLGALGAALSLAVSRRA